MSDYIRRKSVTVGLDYIINELNKLITDDSPNDGYTDIKNQVEEIKRGVLNIPSEDVQPVRWIPCSERLPEEHESIWAKAKGTDRWSEAMWEKQSDKVIVTELFEDGTTRTDTACTHDGEWYMGVKIVKRKIIAWIPLPEPYQEGE